MPLEDIAMLANIEAPEKRGAHKKKTDEVEATIKLIFILTYAGKV